MKIKELQTGQYFQWGDIIGRKITSWKSAHSNVSIAFLNSHYVDNWEDMDVTPIDFITAVALLAKECMGNNQIVEDFNPDSKVDATTLKLGQFFLTYHSVGFIYQEQKCCYITEGQSGCWDYVAELHEVIPLTMHQAVLYLAKKLTAPDKLIMVPIIKPSNKSFILPPLQNQDSPDSLDYFRRLYNKSQSVYSVYSVYFNL